MDCGGYPAYFRDKNMVVELCSGKKIEIPCTQGFMTQLPDTCKMSLNRFKQIRGAFHPEDKILGNQEEDKCYQIRSTINHLNAASAANYVPEGNLAFDEGGTSCRSRYCPVRMYNKDKPDKFRVDFFILAGSQSYLMHHIDVYQGKNASNVSIAESCWNLPTTMKAVVNAVIKTKIHEGSDDSNGYRVISLDNRYQCPQLAYLLWTR
jgi:Transposase IS4